MLGLVAVLRANGEVDRALSLVERLARRGPRPWLQPMRVRLALDAGRPAEAVALLDASIPVELAVAALFRAGRFTDAMRRYRSGTPRKHREPTVIANLLAGCAVELVRAHRVRGARKAARRALAIDPEALLALVVGAHLHPRAAERARLARKAALRVPGVSGEGQLGDEGRHAPLLAEASALMAAGNVQGALGRLRDGLDREPHAWPLRRRYGEWLLAHGQPADWRTELAELLAVFPTSTEPAAVPGCSACGFVAENPFVVCPRCDAIGSLRVFSPKPHQRHGRPSLEGAQLASLLADLPEDEAETAG